MRENLNEILFDSGHKVPKLKTVKCDNKEPKLKISKNNQPLKRILIFNKYGGCCAYCGVVLTQTTFDIDHIQPKYLGGTNDIKNLNPSCRRCNSWKKTFSIEEFRQEIMAQPERILKSSASARLADDYGVVSIKSTNIKPRFYFEKFNNIGYSE